MKITTLAALFATCAISSSAFAATSDVTFIGAVTSETCPVTPSVDGAVKQVIQLGSVGTSATGTAVEFSLKGDGSTACTDLTEAGSATIAWTGPFNATGLTADSSSLAKDATVILSTANAKTTAVIPMVEGTQTAEFEANKNVVGFGYTAALKGGLEKGNFNTAAAYTVAYK